MSNIEIRIACAEKCGWTRIMVRENGDLIGIPPANSNCVHIGGSNDWAFVPLYLDEAKERMREINTKDFLRKIAELEAERQRLIGRIIEEQNKCDNKELHAQLATLTAENQRLREDLRALVLWAESVAGRLSSKERSELNWSGLNVARNSLAPPKERGEVNTTNKYTYESAIDHLRAHDYNIDEDSLIIEKFSTRYPMSWEDREVIRWLKANYQFVCYDL